MNPFESGSAPCCDPCKLRSDCDYSGRANCDTLRRGNEVASLAGNLATRISRLHNREDAEKIAHSAAEMFDGTLDDLGLNAWVDEGEFLRMCGVPVKRKVSQ